MKKAENWEGDPRKPAGMARQAAKLARTAVAIEILLNKPLRLKNLVELQIGVQLKYEGERVRRIARLVLQPHETKNSARDEAVIEPETAAFIEYYIARFRPHLALKGCLFLFPAGHGKPGHLCNDGMRYQLKRKIADEVGAKSHPHLFRQIVARLTLEDDPNAFEDVRLLLGDKTMFTVRAHHAAGEPARASRRHHERLKAARLYSKPDPVKLPKALKATP